MINEENQKAEETSGDHAAGGVTGMDRNEGQTINGVIGGTGSDLEKASKKPEGNENKGPENPDAAEK